MSDSIQTIPVRTSPAYTVQIAPDLLGRCGALLRDVLSPCRVAVVTDSTVAPLYLERVTASLTGAGFSVVSYVFPAGEAHKNMETLSAILEFLAREHLTRTDCVAALGGGVAGDMAGFAAAVYLRAFLQPAAVLCDTECLATLPQDVFADGAAEAIKTGVLADESLFSLFEDGTLTAAPADVIARCVAYKAGVVERDEKEQGERKLLNLGHTVGHAIEKCSGYAIPHGHAVAAGLAIMARAAQRMGWTDGSIAQRIAACLAKNDLPTGTGFSAADLAHAALSDKKRAGDTITIVVPRRMGACSLRPLPVGELEALIAAGLEG